tara:strand:+ start:55 stop:966 length:912 start_codon:yes stop_codon:yes gene_type:complete
MGYLKLPDEVTEYDWSNPEFQKFTKPIVIRGGCKEMPAFKKWSLKYMKQVFGNTLVGADVFKNLEDMQTTNPKGGKNTFRGEFLELSRKIFNKEPPFYYPSNWYLDPALDCHNKIIQDCVHPSDDYRSVKHDMKSAISFFMGNNTYTGSHVHIFSDFLVNVLVGKKIFYMWSFTDNPQVNFEDFHSTHYHTKNFWKRDHSKMKIYKVELNAGDSMLLPPWWYHAVYSPGFCIGIAKVYIRPGVPDKDGLGPGELMYYRENLDKIFNLKEIENFTDESTNHSPMMIIIILMFLIASFLKFKRVF